MNLPETMRAFTLREIAAWQDESLFSSQPERRAKVPVLQRGLVWDPSQVELLWDSLLRGFPVGALVLSKKIPGQEKDSDKSAQGVDYHLLDGQQRANTIALAYRDPFMDGGDEDGDILWLDLAPEVSRTGTRQFVLRLTTKSHPWGYELAEKTKTLRAHQMRESLKSLKVDVTAPGYVRPAPIQLSPLESGVPVPLAWLLRSPVVEDEESYWDSVANRARSFEQGWASDVVVFLEGQDSHQIEARKKLHAALLRLESYRMIGVEAPPDIMKATQNEQAAGISGIEHLFQRLNSQGTALSGEELAYSMIKAYWPELAGPLDRIETRPMPASRMVNIALRVALTKKGADRIVPARSVSQIRKLAQSKKDQEASSVEVYLRDNLALDMAKVDQWLSYDASLRPHGLLPVLSGNLARSYPDLFCLLLMWATRGREGEEIGDEVIACLPGLCTLIMWFGSDYAKVVAALLRACQEEVNLTSLQAALDDARAERSLLLVQSPQDFRAKMDQHHGQGAGWTWETWFGDLEGEAREAEVHAWERLWQQAWNRDLLLYAQRHYLAHRFPLYDPAKKDLWEGHNRPWDFDHICAHKYFYHRKNREVARQWGNTIGNLRAWPFEDNRSDQFELADAKLGEGDQRREDSFIAPDEVAGFSKGDDVSDGSEGLQEFSAVVQSRLIRIYRGWFESAGIARFTRPENSERFES